MALKDEIIKYLQDDAQSMQQLINKTGKSYKNIQARISELRKDGYNIELKPITVQKYILVNEDTSLKIIKFIDANKLFNKSISLNKLARELNITVEEAQVAIGKLFDKYGIIQLDKDNIIIKY